MLFVENAPNLKLSEDEQKKWKIMINDPVKVDPHGKTSKTSKPDIRNTGNAEILTTVEGISTGTDNIGITTTSASGLLILYIFVIQFGREGRRRRTRSGRNHIDCFDSCRNFGYWCNSWCDCVENASDQKEQLGGDAWNKNKPVKAKPCKVEGGTTGKSTKAF